MLTLAIKQEFENVVARNNQHIGRILLESIGKCTKVYTEKMGLPNSGQPHLPEEIERMQKMASFECEQEISNYIRNNIDSDALTW
jgi:hypothetical protein